MRMPEWLDSTLEVLGMIGCLVLMAWVFLLILALCISPILVALYFLR